MKYIYIQKGYTGREATHCLNYTTTSDEYELVYVNSVSEITNKPECIISSVDFFEQYSGNFKPNYYPSWASEFLRREIQYSREHTTISTQFGTYYTNFENIDTTKPYFIKPSDRYKRYEGKLVKGISLYELDSSGLNYDELTQTPSVISDVVNFVDEWRYYVVNGEVVSSWWYKGNEETSESNPNGPYLRMKIPKDFTGAVDMGILDTGEFALVEVQHPYAIGWYGDQDDFENYLNFLIEGFKSL